MSDNLNIQIDTARAQQSLDSLGTAADRLLNKLGQLNGTTNLDKVVQALTNLDTASAKVSGAGFQQLQDAINKLDASKLASAAQQLQGLGSTNLNGVASSVTQLQNAINGIQASNLNNTANAMGAVRTSSTQAAQGFDSFATAVRNAVGQVGGLTANAATMAGAFFNAGGSVVQLNNNLASILGVSKGVSAAMLALGAVMVFKQLAQQAGELAQAIAAPAVQIDRFKSSIDSIAGAGAGAKAFDELQKITKQVGGNIGAMLDPFQKFVIAAKSAGVEMQTSVNVFRGFQTGLTATGASAQQTERVFNALQQMMAKGTVQAEELKGQLGDSMAGALDIAAKSMGVTTKELLKLVESGKVMSADLLPKMARELENTFGSAARARMQGFTGQLDALRNNMFNLTAALGQGALGGALAGFANFMRQINTALTMPGLADFTKLLGDLMGVMTTLVGSVLGGVVQGLAAMASGIGAIYGGLTGALSALKEWLNTLGPIGQGLVYITSNLGTFMASAIATATAVATVTGAMKLLAATSIGQAVAGWATALGGFAASLATTTAASVSAAGGITAFATATGTALLASLRNAGAATVAFAASLTSWSAISAAASGAVTLLTGAVTRLFTVLMANPFVAAAAAATALFVALKQFGVLDDVAEKFTKMTAATEAAKTSSTLFAEAADRLAVRSKLGADAVYDAATKFATYSEMATRAKQASAEMEEQQKNMSRELAENGRQLKEQELREKSYQESIKASSEALKYRIDREKEAKASAQELGKIVEQQDRLNAATTAQTKASADGMSKVRDALKQNTVEYDVHGQAIARLNAKLKENDAANKASESAVTAAKAKHEELSLATQRSSEAIEKAQESIKKYGVILDENQQKLVGIVERTGKYKEEAATLAVQISNLVRPQSDWIKLLSDEMAINDRKIAANQELIAMLEREKSAIEAKVANGQKLTDLDKLTLDRINAAVAARKQDVAGLLDTKMAQEALSIAKEKDINLSEAAAQVAAKYKEATNGTADAAKIAANAINESSKQMDSSKSATEKAAEASKQSADASQKQAAEQKKVADTMASSSTVIETVSGAWTKLTTALGGVTTAIAPIETQLQSTAAAVVSMSQNIGPLATNLPQVAAGFTAMKEPIAAIAPTLEPLTAAFNAMGTAVPVIAPGLTSVRDAFIGMQQALPPLVEPFVSLRTSVEGMSLTITPVAEGFTAMAQSFPTLAAAGAQVAQSFTAIGGTVDKVKELPGAVTAMSTSIDALQVSAEKMTERAGLLNEKLATINETFIKSKEATDAFVDNMKAVDAAIGSTIDKLDALIEKARAAQRELANTNGGGGGGGDKITAGSQRYGGYSGGGIESSVVSSSAFDNAPRLAQGIANTNSLTKRAQGGIPTILHPNEAVVPLPKGRSIPVDMRVDGASQLSMAVQNAERTLNDLADMSMPEVRAPDRASYVSPLEATGGRGAVGAGGKGATPLKESAAVEDGRMARSKRFNAGAVDPAVSSTGGAPISVNITVNAKDADSFKRSQGQIQSDLFRAISRQAAKDR